MAENNKIANTEGQTGRSKSLEGKVVSAKMQKTRVVEVNRYKRYPKYGKFINISKRFKAQDEKEEYKVGDKVEIRESRPLSRGKHWVITRLIERPEEVEIISDEEKL